MQISFSSYYLLIGLLDNSRLGEKPIPPIKADTNTVN